jgi:hypothetical protein
LIPKDWKLALDDDEDAADHTSDQAAGAVTSIALAKRRKTVRFDSSPVSQELMTLPLEDEDDADEEDYNPDQDMDSSEASEDHSQESDSDTNESDSDDSSSDASSSSVSDSSSSNDEESNDSVPEELPSKVSQPKKGAKSGISFAKETPVKPQQPPGQGLSSTQARNLRKRAQRKVQLLKHYGILSEGATMDDLKTLKETVTEEALNERIRSAKQADPALADARFQKFSNYKHFQSQESRSDERGMTFTRHLITADSRSRKAKTQAKVGSVDAKANEKIELQQRAKALLAAIENDGGIDVTPERLISQRNGKNGPQPGTAVATHENGHSSVRSGDSVTVASEQTRLPNEMVVEQPATKRARLDLAGSRRLLFGSLGVRNPKSKEEEEKLRAQLAAKPKAHGKAQPSTEPEPKQQEPGDSEDSDVWKSKINLTAFECWDEGIELSTPPFPFVQRWDPQQKIKNDRKASKGKKRKRANAQYYDDGLKIYGEFYAGGNIEDSSDAQLNYDDDHEYATVRSKGDDDDRAVETQLQQDIEGAASRDDLPALPADISTLPDLTFQDIKKGTVIAFKQLAVGPETGWAPVVLPFRTAIVVDFEPEERRIGLKLALRDQPLKTSKHDANGNRIYEKFEMEHSDSESDSEEAGWVYLQYDDLIEPKLLQAPSELSEHSTASTAGMEGEKVNGDMHIENAEAVPPLPPTSQLSPGQELHMLLESSGSHVGVDQEEYGSE